MRAVGFVDNLNASVMTCWAMSRVFNRVSVLLTLRLDPRGAAA
jgi:hypothetical protein